MTKKPKITNYEELGKYKNQFPDDKEKKTKEAKEFLYDLIDEIEKKDKELYEKILQGADYLEFDERMARGEKTEKEIKEKYEYYKKEFEKSSKSKSMEKPIKTGVREVTPKISPQKTKDGGVKKKWIIKNVYEEDRKDAESGEGRELDIKEAEWRYKENIKNKKKSAKQEVATATVTASSRENILSEEKIVAEESQKTAEAKIDTAGTAAEKTATEIFEEAQAMEAEGKVEVEATIEAAEIEKAKEPEIKKETTEEEKREIQDYIYGDKGRHLELYKLWAGKSDEKEFSNGYRIPQEAEKAAFDFFQRREEYSKYFKDESAALRECKKSGYEKGTVELETAKVWKNNAEKALKLAQEELKRKLADDAFAKKVSEYEGRGVVRSDKDRKEEYAMITGAMLPRIVELDGKLEQMKMNTAYETKERGIFGKVWDKYKGLPKGKRLLASAAMSAGIGAGIAAFSPFGLVAGAGYVGYRAARTLGGGALGAGLNAVVDKLFIQKKYGAERQEALSQQSEELRKALLTEMESGDWKKEEKKMKLMEMLDNSALSLGGKYNDIAQREGKTRMWTALGTGLVGGLTASGIDVYMMKPAGISHSTTELFGKHTGEIPKGGMVAGGVGGLSEEDILRRGLGLAPEAKQNLGANMPNIFDIEKPAGIKLSGALEVHKGDTVWSIIDKQLSQGKGVAYDQLGEARKTFAIDALKDKFATMSPDQLKAIGISSGNINELAIGDKIDLSKIMADENVAKAFESAKGLSQEQLMSIHENLKEVSGVDRVSDLPPQTAEAIKIGGEKIAVTIAEMESPAGKIGGILNGFNEWDKSGLKKAAEQMGGWDKFMNMKASELFPSGDLSQPGATNIYLNKFAYGLQRLTNDAPTLHDGKTTVKDILNTIKPEKVFGAEYKG